jgi:hypothetical protein
LAFPPPPDGCAHWSRIISLITVYLEKELYRMLEPPRQGHDVIWKKKKSFIL